MKTPRVILKRDTVRLTPARQRVLDAEAALAKAEEEATEDDEAGIMDDGSTHIHIHTGAGEDKKTSDKGKGKVQDDGDEPDGDEPDDGGDPLEARVQALEGGMSAMVDAIKSLTAAVRGKEGDGKAKAEDEESEEEDDAKAKGKTGDEEEDEDDKVKAKAEDEESEEEDDPKAKTKTDDKGKTKDSAALATSYADTLAKAEILVPGFRMPTFDSALPRAKTIGAMCGLRRRVLDTCAATTEGLELVTSVNGGKAPDLNKFDCASVATLFKAAAGAKALINNRTSTADGKMAKSKETGAAYGHPKTVAEINAASAKFWADQQQAGQH